MGIVHDDNTEFQIFDQLLFEVMLNNFICNIQKKRKRNGHNREESLIKDIELMEKNYTRENEDGLKTKQKELQELRKKKMEGMLIRSGARWIGEGEKVSKYFCNLKKRHYTSKIIRKI